MKARYATVTARSPSKVLNGKHYSGYTSVTDDTGSVHNLIDGSFNKCNAPIGTRGVVAYRKRPTLSLWYFYPGAEVCDMHPADDSACSNPLCIEGIEMP